MSRVSRGSILPPAMPPAPLLQAHHLTKVYPVRGSFWQRPRFIRALDAVNLHLDAGETLGVVGETGSGKSTLGKTILRLIEPDYGALSFEGQDFTRWPRSDLRRLRRQLQWLGQDQDAALNPAHRVATLIAEGPRIHGLTRASSEQSLVEAALDAVGLPRASLSLCPGDLSAGERQRVALARALSVEPKLLVCDEPLTALDVSVQAQLINLLLDLQSQRGLACVFISHDLRVVRYISHRIAVMYFGRIVEVVQSAALDRVTTHPYTRALFSASPLPHPRRRRLRLLLEGEPPDPTSPPPGCPFHPRCPIAQPGLCDEVPPALLPTRSDAAHWVACHLVDDP